jgi:putative transposase
MILVPKFRYSVLNVDIENSLKDIIIEISNTYGYEIITMEIMPDHIHMFIGAKPTVAPIDIIRTIKSITTIKLFEKFPDLKQFYSRCGSLWSVGKFISTIGNVSEETVKKYIEEQKNNK